MTAPRWSRRRVLVEIRRLRNALGRADRHFARASDWDVAEVDAVRVALAALEAWLTGRRPVARRRAA